MAEGITPKTKTLGRIEKDALKKIPGWSDYLSKATALTKARAEAEDAKDKIRDLIKKALKHDGEIDFVMEGDKARVFEVLERKERGRQSEDLSSMFR